jgi:AraC-like DNA-binding protein
MTSLSSHESTSGRIGLERSCGRAAADWIAGTGPVGGVELFRARLAGRAYEPHRHDTYAIGVTDSGVQVFDYRGAAHASTAGHVVVLHPDERHDGRAGTDDAFGYRIVYVQPARIAEAIRVIGGRSRPLPFVREPVSGNARLARAVHDAFIGELTPLAADGLVVALAEGLLEGAGESARARPIDVAAVERARLLLEAERTRVVESGELEAITGMTRYELARQFRAALGTSPYRYLLMRRLDLAKRRMLDGHALADVACDTGFADQAHFTRVFKSAFGLAPGRYRALLRRP